MELCISCDNKKTNDDFLEIRLKELIEDWEINHHNQEQALKQKAMYIHYESIRLEKSILKKLKKSQNKLLSIKMDSNEAKRSSDMIQNSMLHIKMKIQTRYKMPPLIRKLYPYMKEQDYLYSK